VKPVDFELHRPASLDEAVALLAEHGEEGKVLAGGQSLLPLLNFRLARPEHLIDLGRIESLVELRRTDSGLTLGSMVRHAAAERAPAVARDCPLLAEALPQIAHPPIRNRGTVGGSLAHADAVAELPSVATALDARFVAVSTRGRREIASADFFQGYLTTALRPDEVLTEIHFPRAAAGTGAAFREVARRRGDFALVGVAVQLTVVDTMITEARVCFSGVASVPLRCTPAEAMLHGSSADLGTLDRAVAAARAMLSPPSDLHAPADYRRHVAGVLLRRAVQDAYRGASASVDTPADSSAG